MKATLKDIVIAVAVWSLAIDKDGNVNVIYQKELVDDAPGDANDKIIDIGEIKTLPLSADQSKLIADAISGLVEGFINDAEAASGTTAEETAPPVTDEPPAVNDTPVEDTGGELINE